MLSYPCSEVVYYCGRECQAAHYPAHRDFCMRQAAEFDAASEYSKQERACRGTQV